MKSFFSFAWLFLHKSVVPRPMSSSLQDHGLASKRDGEVLAQKHQYQNHQGKTAMQIN